MSKCELHADNDVPGYYGWYEDAEARHTKGQKQRLCPECQLWIWEELYYKREAKDES